MGGAFPNGSRGERAAAGGQRDRQLKRMINEWVRTPETCVSRELVDVPAYVRFVSKAARVR
jgi:hypothetical protein